MGSGHRTFLGFRQRVMPERIGGSPRISEHIPQMYRWSIQPGFLRNRWMKSTRYVKNEKKSISA
jgi:hypothetical protein